MHGKISKYTTAIVLHLIRYLFIINVFIFVILSFVVSGGEYLFADPDSKLSKYAPKSWRASHTHVSIDMKDIIFRM